MGFSERPGPPAGTLPALLASLALAGLPGSARAFTVALEGNTTASGWPTTPISVDLDPSCAGNTAITTALSAAVSLWSSVSTSNLVVSFGTTRALGSAITNFVGNSPTQQYVGGPLIFCDSSFDSHFGFTSPSDIPGLELAPTLACTGGSTNCPIQGGLVVLNIDPSDQTSVNNLSGAIVAVVVAHELGHALGFGHSADTNALMYFDATLKTQLRLAQDDANAVSFLYPRNELGGAKIFGCGSLAATGGPRSRSGRPDPAHRGAGGPFAEMLLLLAACLAITRHARKGIFFPLR